MLFSQIIVKHVFGFWVREIDRHRKPKDDLRTVLYTVTDFIELKMLAGVFAVACVLSILSETYTERTWKNQKKRIYVVWLEHRIMYVHFRPSHYWLINPRDFPIVKYFFYHEAENWRIYNLLFSFVITELSDMNANWEILKCIYWVWWICVIGTYNCR